MDISQPQFRESIIAMDGEIVRPRVRTLTEAAALTPRASVCLFKDDSIDEYYMPRGVIEDNNGYLVPKVIPIGDWNMDSTPTLYVLHEVPEGSIRFMQAFVRRDPAVTPNTLYPIDYQTDINLCAGSIGIQTSNPERIELKCFGGGYFDNAGFDEMTYNRGWIFIHYLL